jgi:hypothetical protein
LALFLCFLFEGDKFQAVWVVARFRGQFQEPVTVNLGTKNLALQIIFIFFPIYLFS